MDDEFTKDDAIQAADAILKQYRDFPLASLEADVIRHAWNGETYARMSEALGYSEHYINKDVGNRLWKDLSNALAEPVTKTNFREPLRRWRQRPTPVAPKLSSLGDSIPFVMRPPMEDYAFRVIQRPKALLRIKAPQKMGKTTLMNWVLVQARDLNYHTVAIDLGAVDPAKFADLRTFLQWFCAMTTCALRQNVQLSDQECDCYGNTDACTFFFQNRILSQLDQPLVLALDNFDNLFERAAVFENFCRLLRSWHDRATSQDMEGQLWQKLRLVVVHSTQSYPQLDTNASPFNVGECHQPEDFSLAQVTELAQQVGSTSNNWQPLLDWVGGHPNLVHQALVHLRNYPTMPLAELLELAPTEAGLYRNHLHRLLDQLKHFPQLGAAYREVLTQGQVNLESKLAFHLHSMGLTRFEKNFSVPSYRLYQQYFSEQL